MNIIRKSRTLFQMTKTHREKKMILCFIFFLKRTFLIQIFLPNLLNARLLVPLFMDAYTGNLFRQTNTNVI